MQKVSSCCGADITDADAFEALPFCPDCKENCGTVDADEAQEMRVNGLLGRSVVYASIIFVCGLITGSLVTAMYAAELIARGN